MPKTTNETHKCPLCETNREIAQNMGEKKEIAESKLKEMEQFLDDLKEKLEQFYAKDN